MGKFSFSKLLNQGPADDQADYAANQAKSSVVGVGDGSAEASANNRIISSQRQANRVWGRAPKSQGDEVEKRNAE